MSELVGEDCSDYGLVDGIVREVHEEGVGAEVGVLCQVNPCEVLVLDEDGAMRRSHRSECKGTLEVLTGRRVVQVDGVCLEDVVATHCSVVNVFCRVCGR